MRLALTLIVFVMVGVTITGSLITILLAGPFTGKSVQELLGWVALAGFLIALPVSYVIAGYMLTKMKGRRGDA